MGHLASKTSSLDKGNALQFHWMGDYSPKHFTESFIPKKPVVCRLQSDDAVILQLCPMRALNIYFNKLGLNARRVSKGSLWKFDTKGLTRLFNLTVLQSRQRKNILDIIPIAPHQVRKFAASYSFIKIGSSKTLEKLLIDRMGCSSMTILRKNYIAEVPELLYNCVLPIGTFNVTE